MLMSRLNSGLRAKCSECVNTIHSSVATTAEAPFSPPPPDPCLSVPCVRFSPQTGLDQPGKHNSESCSQPAVIVGERPVIS